jgi:uncharacterized membrane protein YccC
MPLSVSQIATQRALVSAVSCVLCLVAAEAIGLEHSNLAVWTTFLVTAQYPFSRFQKGLERVIGRGFGILAGLILTTWFNEQSLVALSVTAVLLTFCFYVYFAGRLAYTFLNAGLYLVATFHIGHSDPNSAVSEAEGLFYAVAIGVLSADVVVWLSGSELSLAIQTGEASLWPIRRDWLSQSVMLVVTVILTLLGARVLGLPPEKAAVSVMLLTVSPHLQALLLKGELRILGLVLAVVWSVVIFLLIGLLPYFVLLASLLFLGILVATYLTQTLGKYSYAGMQMGLVLPLIVVARPAEFGSFTPAVQRLEGVVIGLAASILVAGLWPLFPVRAVPQPPPPNLPGEMDV